MKILVVFGTRPEAIKMAPVILEMRKFFEVKICVTAQHREMLDQVLDIFEIQPDYDLDIMKPGQDLFNLTSNVLLGIREVLSQEGPDIILVHGDTTTAMVTSMAAFYLKIPLGHIEAGLRTYNMYSPFPEEFNRQVISRVTQFHFAPTEGARQNLLKEQVLDEQIYVTGNTVIDALFSVIEKAREKPFSDELLRLLPFLQKSCDNSTSRMILVTGHRRENFGKGFEDICLALLNIAKQFPNVNIVYPVHLNPKVREIVGRMLTGASNIHLIEPLDYLPFIKLMDAAYFILTDSGGIQEEAPSLGKPVLVLRNNSERPEAIEAGTVKLVGTDRRDIEKAVYQLLTDDDAYKKMAKTHNPYGNGLASKKVCEVLMEVKL